MPVSPHDSSAEMSAIGACILDPSVIDDVLTIVGTPEAFFHPEHRTIFSGIVHVYEVYKDLDLVLLQRHLTDQGVYEQVGGANKLGELAGSVPAATNAAYYARIVADKAKLRRVAEACDDGAHRVRTGGTAPASEVAAEEIGRAHV